MSVGFELCCVHIVLRPSLFSVSKPCGSVRITFGCVLVPTLLSKNVTLVVGIFLVTVALSFPIGLLDRLPGRVLYGGESSSLVV